MIRGKNGEPKRGVLIDFDFTHAYYYTNRSTVLKTDKDGIVHLGRLKNIRSVSYISIKTFIVQCETSSESYCQIYLEDLDPS